MHRYAAKFIHESFGLVSCICYSITGKVVKAYGMVCCHLTLNMHLALHLMKQNGTGPCLSVYFSLCVYFYSQIPANTNVTVDIDEIMIRDLF